MVKVFKKRDYMGISLGQRIIDKIRGKEKREIKSYSQSGEDILINFVCNILGLKKINYLDIGAHHSSFLSNTRFFYEKGSKGVLVEPDPVLFSEIKKNRKKDVVLNCGIGVDAAEYADFYVMSPSYLNTFSEKEALKFQNEDGAKIEKVIPIELKKISNVIDLYFKDGLDFMSLDIEGLDFEVLKSMDFNKYRPKVLCVETLNHDTDRKKLRKNSELINYMLNQNYFVYADTFINTIFVDKNIW